MKRAVVFLLAMALIIGAGVALAQAPSGTQGPQQPMMGPGMMMCPCMMMMGQKQMSPEDMKKMQEQMMQWMQACPMMKMMGPQQQPPQQQKK
jgi:hypothetical protein